MAKSIKKGEKPREILELEEKLNISLSQSDSSQGMMLMGFDIGDKIKLQDLR